MNVNEWCDKYHISNEARCELSEAISEEWMAKVIELRNEIYAWFNAELGRDEEEEADGDEQ